MLWAPVFFGAYMKKYRVGEKIKKHIALLLYVFCAAGSFLFSFYFKFVMKNFLKVNVNYLQYTSPFIILCAVFLFIFFSKLSFGEKGEKFINFITPAALGVYLIHTNPFFFDYVIGGIADFLNKENPVIIILGIIGISLAVFIICIMIDLLRIQLFRMIRLNALCKKLDGVFNSKKMKIIEIEEPAIEAKPVEETKKYIKSKAGRFFFRLNLFDFQQQLRHSSSQLLAVDIYIFVFVELTVAFYENFHRNSGERYIRPCLAQSAAKIKFFSANSHWLVFVRFFYFEQEIAARESLAQGGNDF